MTAFQEIAAEDASNPGDRSSFLERMRAKISAADVDDRKEHKARREEMKKKSKDKRKAMMREEMEDEPVAMLGGDSEHSDSFVSEAESEDEAPPTKRAKTEGDLEAMAMQALQGL